MWVCLTDAFFSIVHKDCARDELLVRARRPGDIEKIFPKAKVTKIAHADYLCRAVVKRTDVEKAMVGEVKRITYDNFKDSVRDDALHVAYLRCWSAMLIVQPCAPGDGPFAERLPTHMEVRGILKQPRKSRAKLKGKGQ